MLGFLIGCLTMAALIWVRFRFFGFRAQSPDDYADADQVFDIRDRLKGEIDCEGVIYGPTGRVTSRFVGLFRADWQGDQGVMKEHFRYETGAEQDRIWQLRVDEAGQIRATAPDVVGNGTGKQAGSSVVLSYKIRLPKDAGGHVLSVRDWMYLTPDGAIVNRSQFRKFGIQVAELVATMRPREMPGQVQ